MNNKTALHAKTERHLHGLDGVVAAVGITGIIGLAHAGDKMPNPATIGERAGKRQKARLRPGTKVVGRPDAAISIVVSRVSAVSEIAPSASSFST